MSFSCPQLPPLSESAENVSELRPQDIKVVMALGDSITAGIYKIVASDKSIQTLLYIHIFRDSYMKN